MTGCNGRRTEMEITMSERTLLLGFDLGDEKSQMAVYDREKMEPVLIGQTEENPEALINTEIALDGMEPLTDFLVRIRRGEEIVVDGKVSHPVNMLSFFFRKTLSLTRQQYPGETIKQLVVTTAGADRDFTELIYAALEQLGIGRDRAYVMDHKQTFPYYVLYQKKELWVNDVGLFDCEKDRLTYYQMQVDRGKNPILVGVQERDYSDALDLSENGEEHRAAVFENVVYGAIHKQLLSTLYMTGDGFEGGWADSVFRKLCVGRRLFKGRNLYVSGACYVAKEFGESKRLEDYLLLDEEMISSHLSIQVYADAKLQEISLARAGTPWYMVDREISLIPEGDSEITLTAKNIFDQREKQFILDLDPVEGRLDRHCRLGMRVRFESPKRCIVTLKDGGFGEFFPTSNRIWEKTVEL